MAPGKTVTTLLIITASLTIVTYGQTGPNAPTPFPPSPATTQAQPPAAGSSNPNSLGAPVQPPATPTVPDWTRYRFFFLHLANLDKLAAQKDAEGKDGSKWRSHAQRAAGLSEAEGAILKQVAFDCNQAVEPITAQMDTLDANFRAQLASGQRPVYPSAEKNQLVEQKIQIINAHITELQSLLGDSSFQKLDTYLKQTLKVEIKGPALGALARGASK